MLYFMGRLLWFGAVSSQRTFAGVVFVRDEGVTVVTFICAKFDLGS